MTALNTNANFQCSPSSLLSSARYIIYPNMKPTPSGNNLFFSFLHELLKSDYVRSQHAPPPHPTVFAPLLGDPGSVPVWYTGNHIYYFYGSMTYSICDCNCATPWTFNVQCPITIAKLYGNETRAS